MAKFNILDSYALPGQCFVIFCESLDKNIVNIGEYLRIQTGKGIAKVLIIGIEKIKGKQLGSAASDIGFVISEEDAKKLEGLELTGMAVEVRK